MDNAHFQESIPKTLRDISSALFELNDALAKLQLLVQDLLFEIDQEQRNKADAEFRQVFEKIRSSRNSDEFMGPS